MNCLCSERGRERERERERWMKHGREENARSMKGMRKIGKRREYVGYDMQKEYVAY